MTKRSRMLVCALAALFLALGVYFEPTHCVRGWLHGEAFYDGRPTSYWAIEIEQWECAATICEIEQYARRSPWPRFLQAYLPEPKTPWPRLLDGDADGLQVLHELREHPSAVVRDWARVGIERIGAPATATPENGERGPTKDTSRNREGS